MVDIIKLHIGCGWRNFGDDWVHIDGGDYDHLDYSNITKLEFEDNSIDLIYASHVLEYFDRVDVRYVLDEWHRALKPNGVLRVAVPDFQVMSKLYSEGLKLEEFLGPIFGKMDMGDEKIYHRTAYDFTSLMSVLNDSGFKDVNRYDWRNTEHANHDDHSQAYKPHMDKDNGTLISLNIECKKI